MRTAYIELNTTNQIISLSAKNSLEPFVYLGIHMYPSTKVTSLSEILNKEFDYIILDMGILTSYTAAEFSKCHKQFLVCDFCQWKKRTSLEKLEDLFQNTNLCKDCVTVLVQEKNKSVGLNFSNLEIKAFPPLSNPFQLEVTVLSDLNRLLL